jgi:TonB family protein
LRMARQLVTHGIIAALLMMVFAVGTYSSLPCFAQETISRRVKTKVAPAYPEMARRMGLSGTVKLTVVVAPNGSVKTTTALGGHPVLLNAAMDAVKKWKFEPAGEESTGTIEIKFTPHDN